MKCHVLSCGPPEMSCFVIRGPPPPGCAARASAAVANLAAGFAASWGSVAVIRASLGAKGGTGVPVFRACRVCGRARARAGVGAGAVRAADCARETAHAPLPLAHAGGFFGPQPVAFCRNAERRPRKPPLFTFILSHFASGQALLGTKNENTGYFMECRWNRTAAARTPGRRRGACNAKSPESDVWSR